MFYDAQELLATIDANKLGVLAGGGLAMIFNYIFFWESGRSAMRDKSPAFPLLVCAIWFAHDLSYVLNYNQWFGTYDHWYVKLFWLGLVPTTLFEAFYVWQVWRYGRAEFYPAASQQRWTQYVLGTVLAACLAWWALRQVLDDGLYAWSFAATGVMASSFCLARALRRGDTAGQSSLMWWSYCAMQTTWFTTEYVVFGGMFRNPLFVGMGVLCVACGVIMARMCKVSRQA